MMLNVVKKLTMCNLINLKGEVVNVCRLSNLNRLGNLNWLNGMGGVNSWAGKTVCSLIKMLKPFTNRTHLKLKKIVGNGRLKLFKKQIILQIFLIQKVLICHL
jgi:hypothetical protein